MNHPRWSQINKDIHAAKYTFTDPPDVGPTRDVHSPDVPKPSVVNLAIERMVKGHGPPVDMGPEPAEGWASFWDRKLFRKRIEDQDPSAKRIGTPPRYITYRYSPETSRISGVSYGKAQYFERRGELVVSKTGVLASDLDKEKAASQQRINDMATKGFRVDPLSQIAGSLGMFAYKKLSSLNWNPQSLRDEEFSRIPEYTRGEGFLVDPITAKRVREALKSRETKARDNISAGYRIPNFLLEDVLMAEIEPGTVESALFFAHPATGAVTAGGRGALLAANRAKKNIMTAVARVVPQIGERIPQPALTYYQQMFLATTDTVGAINRAPVAQRVKSYVAKPGNWATKAFTDRLTDINNLGKRAYIGMMKVNADTNARIKALATAGNQLQKEHARAVSQWTTSLGTATKKDLRKAESNIRRLDNLLIKNNADIVGERAGIITPQDIDHMNIEAIVAALPGKNRAWAHEAKASIDEFYKITNSVKSDVDLADYADAIAVLNHQIEIAKAIPDRLIGKTQVKGLEAIWLLRSMKADMRTYLGEARFTAAANASKVFATKYRQLLNDDVAFGLVDPAMAATLKNQYKHYIPIKYTEGLRGAVNGSSQGLQLSNTSQPLKRLREVVNEADMFSAREIFPQMLAERRAMQYRNYIARSFINNLRFDKRFVNAIEEIPQNTPIKAITTKLDGIQGELVGLYRQQEQLAASELSQAVKATRSQRLAAKIAAKQGERNDMIYRGVTQDTEVIFSRAKRSAGPNEVSYFDNGQRHVFRVTKDVQSMIDDIQHMPSMFARPLGWMQAPFRTLYTAANPFFASTYLAVDSIAAMMTTGVGPRRILRTVAENLLDASRKGLGKGMSDRALRYLESGGATAGIVGKSADDIASTYTRKTGFIDGTRRLARGTFGKPQGFLEGFSGALENAPRRAVFEMELEAGTTIKNAAMAAKRSTIDFDRGGWLVGHLNPAYLFLNAGVQASVLIPRAVRNNPRLMAWNTAKFQAVTTGLFFWNTLLGPKYFGTGNYQELPTDERYGHLTFMLPGSETNKRTGDEGPRRIGIPLREFSVLYGPMTMLLENLRGIDHVSYDTFMWTMFGELNPATSITGDVASRGRVLDFPVPTEIVGAIIDWGKNYDSFRDAPIVPDRFENRRVSEQFDTETSELAKKLSLGLFSPFKLDFFLQRGILKDIILGAGQALTLHEDPDISGVDDDGLKAEIYKHADELATKLATTNAEDIQRERNDFLSQLPPELVKFKGDIETIADKDGDIPFVDTMIKRFLRTHGGQVYRTSRSEAQREAGLDERESKLASRRMATLWRTIEQNQAIIDMRALAQFPDTADYLSNLPPVKDSPEAERGISVATWVELTADNNNFGHLINMVIGEEYRGSPYYLTLQETMEGDVSDTSYQEYSKRILELARELGGREQTGEWLYAGWKGIPRRQSSAGVIDWDEVYIKQQEYLSGLTQEQRTDLDSQITQRMSTVERKQWLADQLHAPYFRVAHNYIQSHRGAREKMYQIREAELRNEYNRIDELESSSAWKAYKKAVKDERLRMRRNDPYLDASLRFWGVTHSHEPGRANTELLNMTLDNYVG